MKYIFCLLTLFMVGCPEYDMYREKCQNICRSAQDDNVGSRFMWSDIDRSFGKCTCVSKNGTTFVQYISTRK